MAEPHAALNALGVAEAREALGRCCGAHRWVEAMVARRPFPSMKELEEAADAEWARLDREDFLEAFSHHPAIGAAAASAWSRQEQAGAADADAGTREALRKGNARYAARFGYVFLVCATGKSAAEMLALLEARLGNDPDAELRVAAGELAKITRLRLAKLAAA
jgi:2-oxo-4-hydroxy-4-carboxy-5-ureidoimidazoline decarboxylase